MSTSTQSFLPVDDIRDDVAVMKDGAMAIILQTSAVNFDLLSETEQLAIIGAFAGLLNSLSFSIQIVIRSKRLDISNYIHLLKDAESQQKNPLLQVMMQHYRQFVTNIIRNNEVLDKQFYVVISISALELGVMKDVNKNFEKGITLLSPRRDHIMRQLSRIGLKTVQLNTDKLITLFYDYYNDSFKSSFRNANNSVEHPVSDRAALLAKQQTTQIPTTPPPLQPVSQSAPASRPPVVVQPPPSPPPQQPPPQAQPANNTSNIRPLSRNVPFAVEELPEDYGRP
jgi:hypothetical protein